MDVMSSLRRYAPRVWAAGARLVVKDAELRCLNPAGRPESSRNGRYVKFAPLRTPSVGGRSPFGGKLTVMRFILSPRCSASWKLTR